MFQLCRICCPHKRHQATYICVRLGGKDPAENWGGAGRRYVDCRIVSNIKIARFKLIVIAVAVDNPQPQIVEPIFPTRRIQLIDRILPDLFSAAVELFPCLITSRRNR